MMRDPQSTILSSGCFLDALIHGQLGPTVWTSFVLPEHKVSTPDVEVQDETAHVAPSPAQAVSRDPACARSESAPVLASAQQHDLVPYLPRRC